MVGVWWCHVGSPMKGEPWMKYACTGPYSASSWPCTTTADCLPPPQVLPAGDGHGEQAGPEAHFTQQGLPGGRAFSRHGTTALTPKETSVDGGGWETLL